MAKQITILGNHGKTTLAYFLAKEYVKRGKHVMLVATGMTAPNMGYILQGEKKSTKSLGRLLSLALIDEKAVFDNMLSFPEENIGLLCYDITESKNTYPQLQTAAIATLFDVLYRIADVVIVDSQTELNECDRYALSHSDNLLCITSGDLKGLAYREAIPPEITPTHILLPSGKYNPLEDIRATFKEHVRYELPICNTLQLLYNGGLLEEAQCPPQYEKVLKKLMLEVLTDSPAAKEDPANE